MTIDLNLTVSHVTQTFLSDSLSNKRVQSRRFGIALQDVLNQRDLAIAASTTTSSLGAVTAYLEITAIDGPITVNVTQGVTTIAIVCNQTMVLTGPITSFTLQNTDSSNPRRVGVLWS